MCGLGCGGGGKSSSNSKSSYTPKVKSAGKSSQPALPKGWATGGGSKNGSFGTPKVRATFSGRK